MDIDLYQIIHSSQELTDDHCQAWLMYFWRRAEVHGVEEEIAKERLQFWIICSGHSPTSHDAVDDVRKPAKDFRQSYVPSKDLKKLLDLPVHKRKAPLLLNFIPTYKSILPDVPEKRRKAFLLLLPQLKPPLHHEQTKSQHLTQPINHLLRPHTWSQYKNENVGEDLSKLLRWVA
ncbi:uncharacterized protein LOC114298007 isoform X4 [Camellia sinensis]|nr:uncharacterized protein LOC114298007 isoform X4 [Camellia sinensis]